MTACLLAAACTAGPDFARPAPPPDAPPVPGPVPLVSAGTRARGGETQRFVQGEALPAGWWGWFGSPAINQLIERAFAGNPSLDAARARLRGAASTLAARRALRSPEIAGLGSGSYGSQGGGGGGFGQGGQGNQGNQGSDPPDPTQPGTPGGGDPNQPGGPNNGGGNNGGGNNQGPQLGGDAFAIYTATATVTYDLDIAGRNRRLIESAAAQVEASRQELQAAYLALAGNIVSTALERAALQAQIRAREDLIAAQDQRLALIRIQVAEGATARAFLVTAEAEVASLRATIPPLRTQLAAAEHALAELIGAQPGLAAIPPITLDGLRLPRTVPIALPSQFVRNRPDILASEALLRQASAEVGVAAANLYPNLTLDASFGVGGIDSTLGGFFNIAGQLFAPIFDGGRRQAERDVAVAAYQEALANYRTRVLASFTQVANGIRALENDAVALRDQTAALNAARESYDLALFQEREGAVSSIDVIVVQQRYQNAVFAYVDALSRRFQDTATLFAALGPGPLGPDAIASVTSGEQLRAARTALDAGRAPAAVPAP